VEDGVLGEVEEDVDERLEQRRLRRVGLRVAEEGGVDLRVELAAEDGGNEDDDWGETETERDREGEGERRE
jgi:hypothetical protein